MPVSCSTGAGARTRRARREKFVEAIFAAVSFVPITLPIMRVFAGICAGQMAAAVLGLCPVAKTVSLVA